MCIRDSTKTVLRQAANNAVATFLENLAPTAEKNYSLWKATKRFRRSPIPPLAPLRVNDCWIRDDSAKVEAYATHLEQVFCSQPLDPTQCLEPPPQLPHKSLFVSPKEVAAVLDKLNVRKAPGADQVTARMLQELPRVGILFFTQLLNSIFRLSYIPSSWKIAKVIILHKPGKPSADVKSYRPISLLSIQNKVFEKLLHRKLTRLLPPDSLPPQQFGFRTKHSTVDQVQRVIHTISSALEKKQFCSAVFFDVAQAFDKVWHEGLLFKLRCLLPENICDLLENYLQHRQFFVTYGISSSPLHPITAGVPQGSVLGPLLYTLYTADLPQPEDDTVLATFADDTGLLSTAASYDASTAALQSAVDKFCTWATTWRITINSNKSSHVDFTLRPFGYIPICYRGDVVPPASSARYLGVYLDQRLTYKEHVRIKCQELDFAYNVSVGCLEVTQPSRFQINVYCTLLR